LKKDQEEQTPTCKSDLKSKLKVLNTLFQRKLYKKRLRSFKHVCGVLGKFCSFGKSISRRK